MTLHPELSHFPSSEERLEAEAHRAGEVMMVHNLYEVRDGGLVPSSNAVKRMYYPMGSSRLLGEFGQVEPGNVDSALQFVHRWGSLGYDTLIEQRRHRRADLSFDPLPWVWAHANGVRLALALGRRLKRGDEDELAEYLAGVQVSQAMVESWRSWAGTDAQLLDYPPSAWRAKEDDVYRPKRGGGLDWCCALVGVRDRVEIRGWVGLGGPSLVGVGSAATVAERIIEEVVNQNDFGVHQAISFHSAVKASDLAYSGGPYLSVRWDSLISAIYYRLFEYLLQGRGATCNECGRPFIQTDGRQRFCPPEDGEQQSRCANNNKVKRHRAKKRGSR